MLLPTDIIYLAQPYWHEDSMIRAKRSHWGAHAAAHFMRYGYTVFAPIPHGHQIKNHLPDMDHGFWLTHDQRMLAKCAAIVVCTFPDWTESRGVAQELGFALAHSIPIFQLTGVVPQLDAPFHPEERQQHGYAVASPWGVAFKGAS